jgi:hypothetical protein
MQFCMQVFVQKKKLNQLPVSTVCKPNDWLVKFTVRYPPNFASQKYHCAQQLRLRATVSNGNGPIVSIDALSYEGTYSIICWSQSCKLL